MVKQLLIILLLHFSLFLYGQKPHDLKKFTVIDGTITYNDRLFLPSSINLIMEKMQPAFDARQDYGDTTAISPPIVNELKANVNINLLDRVARVRFHSFWKEGMEDIEGSWMDIIELSYANQTDRDKIHAKLKQNQSNFFLESFFRFGSILVKGDERNIYLVTFPTKIKQDKVTQQLLLVLLETIKLEELSVYDYY